MSGNMDDEVLFMEWAMDTLVHELPVDVLNDVHSGETTCFPSLQALRDVSHAPPVFPELDQLVALADAQAANSGSSGETDGSGSGGANFSSTAAMEHGVWPPSPNSGRCAPAGTGVTTNQPVISWNFSGAVSTPTQPGVDGALDAAAARPYEPGVPEIVMYGPQPTSRRSSARSAATTGPVTATPYAQDHIIAERKRREKINKRFIELSTVIPGLKKMDKATILSDATRHVKELQEKIKVLEEAAGRSTTETVVLVKKPCHAVPDEENGSPSSSSSSSSAVVVPAARNPLPEIKVRFSESGVMVRVLCVDAKGLVVRMMSEMEDGLHLGIIHANVMPFTASTVNITIMAKVKDGFTVTAEEIVGRLNCIATTYIAVEVL